MYTPSTLSRQWYRDDIFRLIPRSLEGMGHWYSTNIERPRDREAYLSTVKECVYCCTAAYNTDNAIERLLVYREKIEEEPVEPKLLPWSQDPKEFRRLAVEQCLSVAEGIRSRFLTCS